MATTKAAYSTLMAIASKLRYNHKAAGALGQFAYSRSGTIPFYGEIDRLETLKELLRISCCGCFGLLALFLILLALPQSRLRYYVLRILAVVFFTVAILLGLYILSPMDIVPDVIPVLGQLDDIAALVGVVLSAISAYTAWRSSRRVSPKDHVGKSPQLPPGN